MIEIDEYVQEFNRKTLET